MYTYISIKIKPSPLKIPPKVGFLILLKSNFGLKNNMGDFDEEPSYSK